MNSQMFSYVTGDMVTGQRSQYHKTINLTCLLHHVERTFASECQQVLGKITSFLFKETHHLMHCHIGGAACIGIELWYVEKSCNKHTKYCNRIFENESNMESDIL